MMVHYLGIYYKKQNDFILNDNFAMTRYIRPPPIQIAPNANSTKSAVVKGLNKMDQKINFFYLWSFEGGISHYKVV